MARFYVGQRVRIKWSNGWPELNGQCGVVTEIGEWETIRGEKAEYQVAPDAWGSFVAPRLSNHGGKWFSACADQLEPITDPGREVIAWSECVWKPEHLRTEA